MREAKSMSIQTVPQIHVPEAFCGLVLDKKVPKGKIGGFVVLCRQQIMLSFWVNCAIHVTPDKKKTEIPWYYQVSSATKIILSRD